MRKGRHVLIAATLIGMAGTAIPAHAYLFWSKQDFSSQPGAEPVLVPLAGATPKELIANKLWSLRAGLNVAALQCQFAPALMTVRNYNDLLKHHAAELAGTYATISAYFKRTGGKTWQTKLDQYTTRTYNGYSTLHAQLGFCEEAGLLGRDALSLRKGQLSEFAVGRIAEFRNSLSVQTGESMFAFRAPDYTPVGIEEEICLDRKGRVKPCRRS